MTLHSTQSVLAKNDEIAQANRLWFLQHRILCLNLISSPGTGKTLLLEKLLMNWSLEKAKMYLRRLNAMAPIFQTSAQTSAGLDELAQWIEEHLKQIREN